MQNESLFTTMIESAIVALKTSKPGQIASEVLPKLFPKTFQAASDEGASAHLLSGFTSAVRAHVKSLPMLEDGEQETFFNRHPKLFPYIQELSHHTYYTPNIDQYVSIFELCEKPELLDSARKFMRQKSEETAAEADRLDDLYSAVIRGRRPSARRGAEATAQSLPAAE